LLLFRAFRMRHECSLLQGPPVRDRLRPDHLVPGQLRRLVPVGDKPSIAPLRLHERELPCLVPMS
jgi:hypothetical protein